MEYEEKIKFAVLWFREIGTLCDRRSQSAVLTQLAGAGTSFLCDRQSTASVKPQI